MPADYRARYYGGIIAGCFLVQTASARGQIVNDIGQVELQAVKIDHVPASTAMLDDFAAKVSHLRLVDNE